MARGEVMGKRQRAQGEERQRAQQKAEIIASDRTHSVGNDKVNAEARLMQRQSA